MKLFRGLRQFGLLRYLIWEIRKFRAEQQHARVAMERIARALEDRNAHDYPQIIQPNPDEPGVEVTYTNDQEQAELMEVEMRLTRATGQPPTEDEIIEEFNRLRSKGAENVILQEIEERRRDAQ